MRFLTRLIGGPEFQDTSLLGAIKDAASLISRDPLLFSRILVSKINAYRKMPPLPTQKRINDVVFEFDNDEFWGTRHMYYGSYAQVIVETMRRFLHRGDTFIDVGANIGYVSAIGAGYVGKSGQVHSFEPVPAYFQKLQNLVRLNPDYTIVANACALGETQSVAPIQITTQIGQNTMVPGLKAADQVKETIEVPVIRLDSYLKEKGLRQVSLVKIDAQGFEMPILKGLLGYFEQTQFLPPIICEIIPRAYPLSGYQLSDLSGYMEQCGYQARNMRDASKAVDICNLRHTEDILFMPAKAVRGTNWPSASASFKLGQNSHHKAEFGQLRS
jgi:FkbM family methyltransferase